MRTRGVTLVEVLIVSGILVVLAAIVFVATGPTREKGREATCMSQLRQIHGAIALYEADNPACDPISQHLGINAWPVLDGRHFLQLIDRELHYCPDTPKCAQVKLVSSYQLPLGVTFPFVPDHPVFKQVEKLAETNGSNTALLRCFVHDELYYSKNAEDVSRKFYKPNAIELFPDGRVKISRINHPPLSMMKDACQ